MAIDIQEHLVIYGDGANVEMYLNDQGDIFVHEVSEDIETPFWFVFDKEDWADIKAFIDKQFSDG